MTPASISNRVCRVENTIPAFISKEKCRVGYCFLLLFFLTALVAAASSCSDETGLDGKTGEYEIDLDYIRGPVVLRVALSRKELTIADHLDLLIEAKARDGYVVELPKFGDKLDQFGIVDYSNPSVELEGDGTVVTRRIYELEPFLSGTYRIPPMTVTFRQEGDSLIHSVESDTISINVLSILPADRAELEMKDIIGPASIPASRLWIYILAGSLIVAAGVIFLVFFLRRKKEAEVRIISAHEIAFGRLERLLAEGLIDEKRYGEFTERVSDILRHYIEDRFGLRAPERTTEEFIIEVGDGLPVDSGRKDILKDFLLHCDLVKFAALKPSAEDVKRTFDTCRDFIDATKKLEEVDGKAA